MTEAGLPSGTVTFLFTDIEGSTRLLAAIGQHRYDEVLTAHGELLRAAFAAHEGRVVDTQGDSFFVVFRTAADAVAAAVDAQRDLAARQEDVKVRMGLHTGEPKVGEDRYVGIGVHRAARIGAAGHGGQVLLSWTTKGLAEEDLPPGVTIRDLGERRLKDIEQPQHLYQLEIEGLPSKFGPLNTLDVELARKRRRMYAGAALIGVLAAAVAIPVFALGQGGSGGTTVQGNGVAEIDPTSNSVVDVAENIGSGPTALTYAGRALWVLNPDDQTITRVDAGTRSVVRNFSLPDTPTSISASRNAVWVVSAKEGIPSVTVRRIDLQYGTVARVASVGNINTFGGTGSVAAAGNRIWVAPASGRLARLRPDTGQVGERIDPNAIVTGVAVAPDAVWLTAARADGVIRVDPATGLVRRSITVGHGPTAIAVGDGAVWVANTLAGTVARIDPATGGVTNTIRTGAGPSGIAVGAGAVWVANRSDGTVTRIDPKSLATTTIRVGGRPQAVAVGGGRVWVSVRALAPGLEGTPDGSSARFTAQDDVDSTDPALAYSVMSWQLEYATCAKLLNYPDKPAPEGTQLVPEVAQALPSLSDGGRTYTFRIRKGFRFSPPSNAPVTAQTFKYTIERSLNPQLNSGALQIGNAYLKNIVGAQAYTAGKARHLTGVTASGDTLTIRLVKPSPDFPTLISLPFFCAVPIGTPIDPKGIPVVPSAGPYYITSSVPGQGVVLERNPNYHGDRPHRLSHITLVVGVPAAEGVNDVQAGRADYVVDGPDPALAPSLAQRYGPDSRRQQYFVNALPGISYLVLNTQRPLFRDARLRRAVNYAIDRRALSAVGSLGNPAFPSLPTDSYLPPGIPGATQLHTYPMKPNVAAARKLAGARHRTAVLYTCNGPPCDQYAQIIKRDLGVIGIDVQVKTFAPPQMFARLARHGEPFDLFTAAWIADYPDPSQFLNTLLSSGLEPKFADATAQAKLAAVEQLSGPARYAAYRKLNAELVRDYAPFAAFSNPTNHDFFSARIGCQVFTPQYGMDLVRLCVRP